MAPEDEATTDDFVPLTAEQARVLRENSPSVSLWWVIGWQIGVGILLAGATWLLAGLVSLALSVACGSLAVVLPAALFARGVTSRFASASVGNAVLSFFVWEFVKIAVTVAILFSAHRLVVGLSWPAMLLGLVVTMKVYWLALLVKRRAIRTE